MIYTLGDGYGVRPLRADDLVGPYLSWFEDQEVCRFNSHGAFPKTAEYFRAYFEASNNEDRVVWAVCHDADGHIGNISLQSISLIDQNAEFAVLIGDRRHWGKGVALAAGRRLIEHGFSKLNLERVYCGTVATNVGMIRVAERLGMQLEGRRRSQRFLDGDWVDVVEFGLLRQEWTAGAGAAP